jgi:cytochrome oxidase Cu insertion factor (SCO1/SenC/PrrC family)
MRFTAFFLALVIVLPGCMSDDEKEEIISYHGRDLDGSNTYRFTLESADGDLWSLDDQKGKVVILVFMFTRCDETCPVTSQNIKTIQDTLTEDELEQISIVSVTVDWRTDSPSKLQNWTEDRGYDWPHLTGSEEALKMVYDTYGVGPFEQEDDSEEGYTVAHTSPTYILDRALKGRVVWSDYDFPTDLFVEDVRTVLKHY